MPSVLPGRSTFLFHVRAIVFLAAAALGVARAQSTPATSQKATLPNTATGKVAAPPSATLKVSGSNLQPAVSRSALPTRTPALNSSGSGVENSRAAVPNTPAQDSAAGVEVARPSQPSPRAGSGRFLVLLDAAHGGDENGAQMSDGTAEKTITLAVSVQLRSLLAARGFQVVTTREGNVKLTPDQRAEIANRLNAAACLSLHATEAGSGVHIFVSSQEPRDQTRFLAWKTAQGAFVIRSLKLASVVNSAFEHNAGSHESGSDTGQETSTPANPIPATLGRTALPGEDSMTCPAIAIEMAPLRGDDRKVVTAVTDSQYQNRVAEALAAAILEWRTDWDTDSAFGTSAGRQP